MNWTTKTYTKEDFIEVWQSSNSIAECARKLNLSIYGATYTTLKKAAQECRLTQDHMTGQGWNRGEDYVFFGIKYSIEEILIENSTYSNTSTLKKRLIKEGLLEDRCYAEYCPLKNPTTNGITGELEPLQLALDHINGVNNDHRLENLRLLCYHCHGQTDTYCRGGKSKKKKKFIKKIKMTESLCVDCGKEKDIRAKRCRVCYKEHRLGSKKDLCICGNTKWSKSKMCQDCDYKSENRRQRGIESQKTKIDWPTNEELLERLSKSNYSQLARELGVSDNAIRKRLRNHP